MIDEPATAAVVLDPLRSQVLQALVEPGSASTVAAGLGVPRQKVNYHLRSLESHGLVRLVEERPRRGLTERVFVASALSYVLSPAVLGEIANDAARTDRLSVRYLIAVAARMVREISVLARRAELANKALATLTIDTEIRFASAGERAAFAQDLTDAVTRLVGKYHDETADGGRWHRLVVAAHPYAGPDATGDNTEQEQ